MEASVAICFVLALFITPIIAVIPALATTCAPVMIGVFMMQGLAELDLKDIVIASTALVTLLLMTLTSVSDGLAIGLVVHVIVVSAAGRWRSIKPMGWGLVALFILHYIVR